MLQFAWKNYSVKKITMILLGMLTAYWLQSQSFYPLGSEVLGQGANENFGGRLDLSLDGSAYILGSNSHDLGKGKVAIYELIGDDFSLRGSEIIGAVNERIGQGVSINSDGTIIALSSNRGSSSGTTGFVRIYQFDGSDWVQLGSDITNAKQGFGNSISLNAAGNIIAVSAAFENSQLARLGGVCKFSLTIGCRVIDRFCNLPHR